MKKIMFNDKYGLTKAVLESRKTQTRRIIPKDFFSLTWDKRDDTLVYENGMGDFIDVRNSKYAQYKVGEVVAVAQSYRDCGGVNEDGVPMWEIISQNVGGTNAGWDNKMFVRGDLMPHQIRITDVRVERLQEITDECCLKEGITDMGTGGSLRYSFTDNVKQTTGDIIAFSNNFATAKEAFAHLINKVSKKGTWEANPYVFVYDFELTK